MNVTVYIIENVIMCLVFGVLVFGMLLKTPLSFISDYPPEIQERYYKSQNKQATKEKLTKIMIVKKIVALICAKRRNISDRRDWGSGIAIFLPLWFNSEEKKNGGS